MSEAVKSGSSALRALVVDDERLARVRLRQLLAAHPHVHVEGEAGSVDEAIPLVRAIRPQVIFLDVQMPGASGFALLEQVDVSFRVVFVTAFDDYAIRAFEVNALDYLLKPVQPERLASAIARLVAPQSAPVGGTSALTEDDSLFLEFRSRPRFVRLSQIVSITGEGPYSRLTACDGASALVLRSLSDWERRLPPRMFLRIHRSAIVNAGHVADIRTLPGYRCQVLLRGTDAPLVMSRRHARRLRQILR